MPPLFRRTTALAVLFSGLLGCKDATAPAACEGPLQVAVSPGATPSINWSPTCGISYLVVMAAPASPGALETTVWGFTVPELTPLGPDVRYGRLPRGAKEMVPPQPLRAGAEYRILLMYTVGGDGVTAMGQRIFVP